MKKDQLAIWPALIWLLITTGLLSLPGSAFPKENWFDQIWLDKWIHIGLFAVMVLLWCRLLSPERKKKAYFFQIALYFFLYGIAMEFIQKYFIPNRSFDIGDIVADGIGSLAGLLISIRLYLKK